ncbi:hypothetical protein AC578_6561 [Pseudocercospora eumusae]|uniref:Uncharacterized protein n=1 Tax=Pseudocercospora eumusae TaxID=321146 RepID=A0A139HHS5_9PEZI|nr:hypothetical protein AC578_6561 [Pseudocercospora eumusae]
MQNSTPAQSASQHFRFLDLPPELRNEISEAYFALDADRKALNPAITQVNRQLHSETAAMGHSSYDLSRALVSMTPSVATILAELPPRIGLPLRSASFQVYSPSLIRGAARPDFRMNLGWKNDGTFSLYCQVMVWDANAISTAIQKYRAWKLVRKYEQCIREKLPGRKLQPDLALQADYGATRSPFVVVMELRKTTHLGPGVLRMDGCVWANTISVHSSPAQDAGWERVVGCVLGEIVDFLLHLKSHLLPYWFLVSELYRFSIRIAAASTGMSETAVKLAIGASLAIEGILALFYWLQGAL